MAHIRVPVRRHQADKPAKPEAAQPVRPLEHMTYRELQAAAIEKGISGKQSKEALIEALND